MGKLVKKSLMDIDFSNLCRICCVSNLNDSSLVRCVLCKG